MAGQDADAVYERELIAQAIMKVVPPFFIVFGTIGNCLSIFILSRKNLNESTTTLYFMCLSVCDMVVLYTGLLRRWVLAAFNADIRSYSSVVCKLHTWMVYLSLDVSAWLLVALTIDRLIRVLFPFKAKQICTKQAGVIVIACIGVSLMAINGHILYGMVAVDCGTQYKQALDKCTDAREPEVCIVTFIDNKECLGNTTRINKCSYVDQNYAYFFGEVWPWLDLLIFSCIPFCLLVVGNTIIITKISQHSWKTSRAVAPNSSMCNNNAQTNAYTISTANIESSTVASSAVATSGHQHKSTSMTVMLIVINTAFLLCTTPICIFLLGEVYWYKHANPNETAMLNLIWAVVNIMMYANNTFNFIFYCLSGRQFRTEVRSQFWKLVAGIIPSTAEQQRTGRMRRSERLTDTQQATGYQLNVICSPENVTPTPVEFTTVSPFQVDSTMSVAAEQGSECTNRH